MQRKPLPDLPLPETPLARVLIIDDSPDVVEVLRLFLARSGFEVISASDGQPGLAAARFFRPHLILLNVQMPGLDGCQVLRRLRANPLLKNIKVIMESGYHDLGPLSSRIGADGFLLQPFTRQNMLTEVHRVLGF